MQYDLCISQRRSYRLRPPTTLVDMAEEWMEVDEVNTEMFGRPDEEDLPY